MPDQNSASYPVAIQVNEAIEKAVECVQFLIDADKTGQLTAELFRNQVQAAHDLLETVQLHGLIAIDVADQAMARLNESDEKYERAAREAIYERDGRREALAERDAEQQAKNHALATIRDLRGEITRLETKAFRATKNAGGHGIRMSR